MSLEEYTIDLGFQLYQVISKVLNFMPNFLAALVTVLIG